MYGARRSDETHAVRAGYLAGPPVTDDIQPTVRGNDRGVGCGYGLGSNEILIDPGKPVAAQRGKLGAYDWLETDVAGAADQNRAQARLEMFDGGLALAQVGKRLGESGSRHDFEKDVWHSGLRHPRLNGDTKRAQALGFIEPVEGRDNDFRLVGDRFETQVGIVAGAGGDMSISLVEKAGETIDFGIGFQRAAQGAGDHQPGILPGLALEHPSARVPVSDAGHDEHVTPLDGETPRLDDREDIGLRVPHSAVLIQDVLPPCLRDRGGRRIAHLGQRRPVIHGLEVVDRSLDALAARGGAGLDAGDDIEEQSPGTAPSVSQFVVGLGLGGLGDRVHLGHGRLNVGTGQPLEERLSPFIEGQSVVGQNQQAHLAKQDCRVIEIAQTAQAGLFVGGFGVFDHVGQQSFGQFCGIVLGRRFERMEERRNGRGSTGLLKGGDGRRFADARHPREPLEGCGGNAPRWRWPQIECPNGVEPIKVAVEFGWHALGGNGPQSVQGGRTWKCRPRRTSRRCAPADHRSGWRPDGAKAWSSHDRGFSRPIARQP